MNEREYIKKATETVIEIIDEHKNNISDEWPDSETVAEWTIIRKEVEELIYMVYHSRTICGLVFCGSE